MVRMAKEMYFIAALVGKRVYIRSAYAMSDDTKAEAEYMFFVLDDDSLPKIIIS